MGERVVLPLLASIGSALALGAGSALFALTRPGIAPLQSYKKGYRHG